MAVNLASKMAGKIAESFSKGSYLKGHTSNDYEFVGVKTIRILTPQTVDEGDYDRTAAGNRYGTPTEMQDTVQELTLTQDKSASLTIDKGNNKDQMNLKGAGKMLKLQIKERTIPRADQYAFGQYAKFAGFVIDAGAAVTKSNIVELLLGLEESFDEAEVPEEDRFLYITPMVAKLVKLSPEFLSLEALGVKALGKGHIGQLSTMNVIKVPVKKMPDNCLAEAIYKGSVIFPFKIQDAKYHQDPPGISGDLLETRHYYDAHVIGSRKQGVAALYANGKVQAKPSVSHSANTLSITSAGATVIQYTTDGTDPMFSSTAKVYSAGVPTGGWDSGDYVVRAVAWGADGVGHSAEGTTTFTI